ncbi:MAG TPA: GNAT family N-acetyltransferase [Vicinamibacterales bacterium]|nr:GNAT family N-acetyltransferase [Vicinamibacterales bacterium]
MARVLTTPNTAICTTRLDLRLLALPDANDVYQYGSDPEVARATSWPAHTNIKDALDFVSFVVASDSDQPGALRHTWAIRRRDHARVIGTIDLIQDNDQEAHTDYVLARSYWKQGFMTEAVQAVVGWGFARLEALERIRSGCLSSNVGSWRVLEKAGFTLTGLQPDKFGSKFDHRELEVRHYEVLRREWGGPIAPTPLNPAPRRS